MSFASFQAFPGGALKELVDSATFRTQGATKKAIRAVVSEIGSCWLVVSAVLSAGPAVPSGGPGVLSGGAAVLSGGPAVLSSGSAVFSGSQSLLWYCFAPLC